MAVQYAFSQITTTGLKLAVDAADPLSYPGSGTTWTDVSGNGFTGTISSSISFATTNRGALVSSNSSSAVSFSGSAADFGTGSFTIEMTFLPSRISGTHWLYSKNSGSFPNFGAFITGSGGSGRIVAFYNVSSTISSSATTAVGSIVTGSNYVLDVTYIPSSTSSSISTAVYLNSNYIASGSSNGTGSLSTSASLLLLNNTTASSAGTMGNLYNFKFYNSYINSSNIRKNYNSMCSRFGLPLALYTPPAPFLLDLYPGTAAAYSLRRLTDFYGGSAIRVRRSSDNLEQDIGFVNNVLDTTSLLSFVGAGDGFVTTWYDQSGNSRNLTQTTAANQLQIVSGGSVITDGGKPCISSPSGYLTLSRTWGISLSNPQLFYVGKITQLYASNYSGHWIKFGNNTLNQNHFINASVEPGSAQDIYSSNRPTYSNFTANLNQTYLECYENISTITTRYLNGVNRGSNTVTVTTPNNLLIGGSDSTYRATGIIQELIIYAIGNSSNRTGIESNINSYYSIY